MKRFRLGLATVLLGVLSMLPAAASFDTDPPKDAEFTYARIRYHMSFDGFFGRELPWHHDYPYAEEAFATFVKQVTNIYTAPNAYQIVDIGMRMLEPHELYAAQGFPADYIHSHTADGKPLSKAAQVRMCGNSVCPPVAAALVRANLVEQQQSEVAA